MKMKSFCHAAKNIRKNALNPAFLLIDEEVLR